MKEKKSYFNFVWDSLKKDDRSQTMLFAIFGVAVFGYYAHKVYCLLQKNVAELPSAQTVTLAIFLVLLSAGIILAVLLFIIAARKVIPLIKRRYNWSLYMWYSEEITKYHNISCLLFEKISALNRIILENIEIDYYNFLSESWKNKDSYVAYLLNEEKYEELANLKKADEIVELFNSTKDRELLKDAAKEAEAEIEKLRATLDTILKIKSGLKNKEEEIRKKLALSTMV